MRRGACGDLLMEKWLDKPRCKELWLAACAARRLAAVPVLLASALLWFRLHRWLSWLPAASEALQQDPATLQQAPPEPRIRHRAVGSRVVPNGATGHAGNLLGGKACWPC